MSKRIIASLIILACALFLLGFYIQSLDFGSCPAIPANATIRTCYHTFEGTDIYITPTGRAVSFVGAVILVLTVPVFVWRSSWWYKHGVWKRGTSSRTKEQIQSAHIRLPRLLLTCVLVRYSGDFMPTRFSNSLMRSASSMRFAETAVDSLSSSACSSFFVTGLSESMCDRRGPLLLEYFGLFRQFRPFFAHSLIVCPR